MDYLAKKALWDLQATQPPTQQAFPLEPICIFTGNTKRENSENLHTIEKWLFI
jgi:hypothetical protein